MARGKPDLKAVREVLAGASDAPIGVVDVANDGGRDDRWDGPMPVMPPGCPVEPLGTENNVFYFLTALGELRGLAADKVANKHIVGMFAPFDKYLEEHWPRMTQDKDTGEWVAVPNTWKADETSKHLMRVAAARGVWNAREKVRGRGAWREENGGLILHCGNHVLIGGQWKRPGLHDGFVYPTAPTVPRPGPDGAVQAAADLMRLLKTWAWKRPLIDPMLLLGWIGIAPFGGALDWRPLAWITGDKATGKSTLNGPRGVLEYLFDGALLQTSDATEAAVRQLVGQQSLPVAIDEAEAEEDNRKMLALVKLARQAASGGRIFRGGQDHVGHEFTAQSCFLFSSILVPPIPPQDRSRLAILDLDPLPEGALKPKLDAAEIRAIGAGLRKRMADGWGRFEKVLELFHNALVVRGGHQGRSADQFGVLIASAWTLMHDGLPDDAELDEWAARMTIDTLAEKGDDASDAERALFHLASSLVQLAGHGTPNTVGHWIQRAAPKVDADHETREGAETAKAQLGKVGLGVLTGGTRKRAGDAPSPIPGRRYIMVASNHQGLARLYEGSRWGGGVWSQALKRLPGALGNERQRIGGIVAACTLVPVDVLLDQRTSDEEDADRAAHAAELAAETAGVEDWP